MLPSAKLLEILQRPFKTYMEQKNLAYSASRKAAEEKKAAEDAKAKEEAEKKAAEDAKAKEEADKKAAEDEEAKKKAKKSTEDSVDAITAELAEVKKVIAGIPELVNSTVKQALGLEKKGIEDSIPVDPLLDSAKDNSYLLKHMF